MTISKAGSGWSLDEYIVVADLYLRRQRSSNARDREVLALAQLTGRTGASISRRLGNFHGTVNDGEAGLKAVTGEARSMFFAMAADEALRDRLTSEATSRLTRGLDPQPVALPASQVRHVAVERHLTAETEAQIAAATRRVVRKEAQLVRCYLASLGDGAGRMQSVLIPVGNHALRVDLFDPKRNLLIEAKADPSRTSIRYAIGQLYDYRRAIAPRPALAVLVPARPADDLCKLLASAGIGVIWQSGDRFIEE